MQLTPQFLFAIGSMLFAAGGSYAGVTYAMRDINGIGRKQRRHTLLLITSCTSIEEMRETAKFLLGE